METFWNQVQVKIVIVGNVQEGQGPPYFWFFLSFRIKTCGIRNSITNTFMHSNFLCNLTQLLWRPIMVSSAY